MICDTAPVDVLLLKAKQGAVEEVPEPIYGGYSNARGEISLFGESLAYRVNFKNQTVRQRPGLNSEAKLRYDAAQAGEPFEYCNARFKRLSNDEIVEICSSGPFRSTPRLI